jgi:hypothetical protein
VSIEDIINGKLNFFQSREIIDLIEKDEHPPNMNPYLKTESKKMGYLDYKVTELSSKSVLIENLGFKT